MVKNKITHSQTFHVMARYKTFAITHYIYKSAVLTHHYYTGRSNYYEKDVNANTLPALKKKIDRFIAKRKKG